MTDSIDHDQHKDDPSGPNQYDEGKAEKLLVFYEECLRQHPPIAPVELVHDSQTRKVLERILSLEHPTILDFGVVGQEFHLGSDNFLKNSAGRNPGGGFGVGFDWFEAGPVFGAIDWGGAITITGKNVPAPGALALLGMAGLVGRRRRRR